jgi:AhpD family alkylhydroperoxidase
VSVSRACPKVIKEQIALVVSRLNTASYCLAAHFEILGSLGYEPKVMELFRFADKLARRSGDIEKAEVNSLREAARSAAAIFDTVLVVAIYACANRF